MSFARHVSAACAFLALTACTTTVLGPAKSPDLVDASDIKPHEERLLAPFTKGHTVLCQKLVIDANPLLFKHVTFPAGTPKKTADADVEEMTWSVRDGISVRAPGSGKPVGPDAKLPKSVYKPRTKLEKFKILIGSTVFEVDDSVTVRSLLRAPPTLTALATGHVMVIQDGKHASTHQQVRYGDGRIGAR